MKVKASLMFAKSLIFPKAEKKSSARKSLIGALLCIGLSIIPLVVVISVTNGMIEGMTQRIIGLSSSHIQAYVASEIEETKNEENFFDFAKLIKAENTQITNIYPQVAISALGSANNYKTGIEIRGLETDIFTKNKAFAELLTVVDGDISSFENNTAVIGQKIAELLNLHAGDSFRVITTKIINGQVAPKLTTLKVGAIITSGYQELDALWVFVPIHTVFSSLSLSSAKYNYLIETEDAFSTDLVILQRNLQSLYGEIANFYRWDRVHQAEFENFSSTKVMLIFIMMLIVLVASINISSAIVMLVMERQKEIAILKSLGASPFGITFAFILAALACGLGGVLIGVPFGLLLSVFSNEILQFIEGIVNFVAKIMYFFQGMDIQQIKHIKLMDPAYYLQTIPIVIPYLQILLIAGSTILLSVVVSLIPSIKAGKEKPLDILRKN